MAMSLAQASHKTRAAKGEASKEPRELHGGQQMLSLCPSGFVIHSFEAQPRIVQSSLCKQGFLQELTACAYPFPLNRQLTIPLEGLTIAAVSSERQELAPAFSCCSSDFFTEPKLQILPNALQFLLAVEAKRQFLRGKATRHNG
jgi:hypothetical protein